MVAAEHRDTRRSSQWLQRHADADTDGASVREVGLEVDIRAQRLMLRVSDPNDPHGLGKLFGKFLGQHTPTPTTNARMGVAAAFLPCPIIAAEASCWLLGLAIAALIGSAVAQFFD